MNGAHPSTDVVYGALRQVIDPEIERDIVSLGLVYGVEIEDSTVTVTFTLTTPGCPLRSVMLQAIEASVYAVAGVDHVRTHLVWEPRWHPGLIQD